MKNNKSVGVNKVDMKKWRNATFALSEIQKKEQFLGFLKRNNICHEVSGADDYGWYISLLCDDQEFKMITQFFDQLDNE